MHAIILSIGDELALGQALDTNSQWLSARLAERSIITIEHRTLADDRAAVAQAVLECAAGCNVLVLSGGLGPTDDDLTRDALRDAATPGEALMTDPAAMEQLQHWFAKRGRGMPAMNARQATRPATFRSLPNPHGTAPGLAGTIDGCLVFSLPGPPREMQPMFRDFVIPALPHTDGEVVLTACVQEFGLGESVAAERLGALMQRDRNPLVGTTASDSIVSARIRVSGSQPWASEQLAQTVSRVRQAWAPYAFTEGDGALAEVVGNLLKSKGLRLATAESCTGGWLGKAIVDRGGSSAWYAGGWVTYSNEMKTQCLDVPQQMLQLNGAVSREVALALAEGALHRSSADCAIAITGIAGPDGGSSEKPVGTVYVALTGTPGSHVRRFEFPGERMLVRDRAVKAALQMLRFALVGAADVPLIWEATGTLAQASR